MRVALLGVGLIGGSIGLAARERLGAHVSGWDPVAGTLTDALRRGAVDQACADAEQACRDAEIAWVAAPVGALSSAIDAALRNAPRGCVVSDVGSTKRTLVAGRSDERFVGGHPLAGAETAGVQHARADLFDGATWYLTPAAGTSGVLYERLHRAIAGLGAQPAAIDPELHDRLMATVSHLPHVLANVLVAQAASALDAGGPLPATGPSFRDATRVAGASSTIWTDIYLANRDALLERIDETLARLGEVREMFSAADRDSITSWNEAARADRNALLSAGAGERDELHELRASVPNRPGVIAEIALVLGRAGVNIVDLALSPSPDNSQGQVALWVRGEQHAARAAQLVGGLGIPVVRA
ncbi:MAG: prephenate dehydrogenase/arogenate dehydrogenase family protein [Solirubrobacteraceae bacterium]